MLEMKCFMNWEANTGLAGLKFRKILKTYFYSIKYNKYNNKV